jgi:hypothetical protein
MAAGLVQQQQERPARVDKAKQAQEGHEVLLPPPLTGGHHAVTGPGIDDPPQRALSVLPSDGDLGLLAYRSPRCAQRRKPPEHGAVHDEQNRTRRLHLQRLQTADKTPFFCPR